LSCKIENYLAPERLLIVEKWLNLQAITPSRLTSGKPKEWLMPLHNILNKNRTHTK